jgi:hypothetical protein
MPSALQQGTDTDLIITCFHFKMRSWPGAYNFLSLFTEVALFGRFAHRLVFGFGPISWYMILHRGRLSRFSTFRILLHGESWQLFVDFTIARLISYFIQHNSIILYLFIIFIVTERINILLSKRDTLVFRNNASRDSFETR